MCQDVHQELWGKHRAESNMPLLLCPHFFLEMEGNQMEILSA